MRIPKFIFFQTLILCFLIGVTWIPLKNRFEPYLHGVIILACTIASFISLVAYWIAWSGLSKSPRKFISYVSGVMVFRMFVTIILLSIIFLNWPGIAREFALSYIFSYFIYTAFEVYVLMSNLRPNLKKEDENSGEKKEVK